jgi:hypothetical protein
VISVRVLRPTAVLLAAVVSLGSLANRAWSQGIYPPAPSTAVQAAQEFDARKLAIVRVNACGRENDYTTFLNEVRAGNFDRQGEELTAIVTAKIAHWYMSLGACEYTYWESGMAQPPPFVQTFPPCARRDVLSLLELNYEAFTLITYTVDRPCLKRQINAALRDYRRHHQLGSSELPCYPFSKLNETEGEYDVNVREILRAVYLGRGWPEWWGERVIEPETYDHVMRELLTVRGSPGPESYSVLYDCGNREEETGSPQEYADRQDWIDRAMGSLGKAGEYLAKRAAFLLPLLWPFIGPYLGVGGLGAAVPLSVPLPIAATAAAVTPATVLDPFTFARIPETENHLLMIETSRYLTNQAMLEELGPTYPNADVIREQQNEVKEWLLARLQSIAKDDFQEYNSRAYQRYSINAIANLHDFAFDSEIEQAARIVLDQASAKFAVGSNRARRFAPFRRRSDADGTSADASLRRATRDLYNYRQGADHQVASFLVLAGQTQLFPNGTLPLDGIGNLVNPATSWYRLPPAIMELAVEGVPYTYQQRIHHVGVELYVHALTYVLSAGGIQSPSANTLYLMGEDSGRGVAVPTILIPTAGGRTLDEVIRFDGRGTMHDRRDNLCVTAGFACGINLVIPDFLKDCKEGFSIPGERWTFINTARCAGLAGGPHFYLAAYERDCAWDDEVCKEGGVLNFGFFEIQEALAATPAGDPVYDTFKNGRNLALNWPALKSRGSYTMNNGTVIQFDILGSQEDTGGIVSINGIGREPVKNWPGSNGPVISWGADGLTTVTNPATGKSVVLDFRNVSAPTWTPQ